MMRSNGRSTGRRDRDWRRGDQGHLRNQRGESLLQTAIVLPLLAMMLFGIAEFSRVLNVQLVINNAARQGARAAATGANVASITQTVRNEAASLTPSDLGIVVTNAQGARGEAVVVALTYPVDLVVDFMGDLFGGSPVLVSAQASMRLE